MNKKFAVESIAIIIIVFTLALGAVQAQTFSGQAVSGLAQGDTFKYSNTYLWTSTMAGDVPPYTLTAQNQSTLQVTVGNVTGSTVELLKIWAYRNGTQSASTEYDEVNSGLTGTVLAYAGNLTAGGLLFPASTDLPFVINSTTYRSYAGGAVRLTNHISVNNTGIEGMAYSLMDLYFDQQTGICVEYTLTSVYTNSPNDVIAQHLVMTESSLWQVSTASNTPTLTPNDTAQPTANPTETSGGNTNGAGVSTDLIIIVVVVVVVIIVAAGFLLPKGKPKQKKAPEEAKEPQTAPEEAPEKAPEEAPKGKADEDSYSI